MLLTDAYEKLKFEPSVKHERSMASRLALAPASSMTGVRRLGTSARMLVELYLDLNLATQAAGLRDAGRVRFIVVCSTSQLGQYLLGWLRTIHETLKLNVDLARVTFFVVSHNPNRLHGLTCRSWGIFCDHTVKEHAGLERPRGPYGLIRRVIQVESDSWEAFDRDQRYVCRLTQRGVKGLTDASTCPITYVYRDGTPAVTFPAWQMPLVNMRLVEGFKP